jgi:hypothetical protein
VKAGVARLDPAIDETLRLGLGAGEIRGVTGRAVRVDVVEAVARLLGDVVPELPLIVEMRTPSASCTPVSTSGTTVAGRKYRVRCPGGRIGTLNA